MKNFTVYHKASGEILRNGQCSDRFFYLQAQLGEAVMAGMYPATDYFVFNDAAVKRRVMPTTVDRLYFLADGVDTAIIHNIPPLTDFTIRPVSITGTVNDGTLVLTTTDAGKVAVTLKNKTFIDKTIFFDAN